MKMLNLEAEKEMLMKENGKMKSTRNKRKMRSKWKDVLLTEAPKTLVHKNLAMNSNTTNGQDAKERYKIGRRENNVVIKGMLEDDSENTLFLVENITKLFEDCFAM